MINYNRLLGILVAAFMAFMWVAPAQAQATRTWVSGTGMDTNPCSYTAPCKTFAGAYINTAANGEINCIDSGGYGGVTISKSLTIKCDGVEAGVLVGSANGITVTGAGVVAYLSGLDIEGSGGTGFIGVSFLSGAALHIRNCTIRGFKSGSSLGVSFAPSTAAELYIDDTAITGNGTGIAISPQAGGSAHAVIRNVSSDNNNTHGLSITSLSGTLGNNVAVRDSTFNGNGVDGLTAAASAGTSEATVWVDHGTFAYNGSAGVAASGANLADVVLGDSSVHRNPSGLLLSGTALIGTYGNNRVNGNTAAETFNQTLNPS